MSATDVSAANGTEPASLVARLDRLPVAGVHLIIAAVGAFGLFLDIAELALSNALSAIFSAPGQDLQPYQLPLLLASVFIGGSSGGSSMRIRPSSVRSEARGGAVSGLNASGFAMALSLSSAW